MSKLNVHKSIDGYIFYLKNVSKTLFSCGFSYKLKEVSFNGDRLIEVSINFSSLFEKKEPFYLYFQASYGFLLYNKYAGSKNYIQKKYEKICAYEYEDRGILLPKDSNYKIFTGLFNVIQKKMFQEKKCLLNNSLSKMAIIKELRKEGGISLEEVKIRNKTDKPGDILGEIKLKIEGNKPKVISVYCFLSVDDKNDKTVFESDAGLMWKDKNENLATFVHRIISMLEQTTDFKFNNRAEIAVAQFFNDPRDYPRYSELFDSFNRWSAHQTLITGFDKGIFQKKRTESELIEANSDIAFLIKELKHSLDFEEPLMKDFLKNWNKLEKYGSGELGTALDLLKTQKEMLIRNNSSHKQILKQMLKAQESIFKSILKQREKELSKIVEKTLDDIISDKNSH